MLKYIIAVFFAILVIFMTFKPDIIAKKLLKKESDDIIFKIKITALIIGALDFIFVILFI